MFYLSLKRVYAITAGICLAFSVLAAHQALAKRGKTGMPRPPAPDESWKNPVDQNGNVDYNRMLRFAVAYSDMVYIKKAVENGADVNYRGDAPSTPLHEAIFNLDLEAVTYLVEHRADVNILNRWGFSPLAWCRDVQGTDEELEPIEAVLIKAGAREIIKDTGVPPLRPWSRPTPEMIAQYNANILMCAQNPNCDLGMISLYLRKGADPNTPNFQGVPAMVMAITAGNEAMVRLLVKHRADVNRLSMAGSALGNAAYTGNMNIVKYLVENGAKLDMPVNGDGNPLMQAFRRNHPEVVRYLLDKGATVRGVTGDQGKVPIHYAAGSGDLDLVKILIGKGADIKARDDGQWDAMLHAAWGENGDVVDYLKTKGGDINLRFWNEQISLLHLTVRNEDARELKKYDFLVSKGIDVHGRNALGQTPLFYAAGYEKTDPVFAERLIRDGADVNAEAGDGYTVLFYAFNAGNDTVGDLLIKGGADINKKNGNGCPMIVLCAEYGYAGPLKAFIKRKANLNATDASGRTALHAAAQAGKKDIYDFLIKSGARRDIRDGNGKTAAEYLKK
jgi:ankyrin repeat protein